MIAIHSRATPVLGTLAILLAVTSLSGAETSESRNLARHYPATAEIRFSGTSTLHDFSGRVLSQPFPLTLSNGSWSAAADVMVSGMDTANRKRDRKMHEMFGPTTFPRIKGVASGSLPTPGGGSPTNAILKLTIRNTTQSVPLRLTRWTAAGPTISVQAACEISLREFNLQPPSVAGIVRVGDRVQLEVTVLATNTTTLP